MTVRKQDYAVLSGSEAKKIPPLTLVAEIKPPIDFPGIEEDETVGNAA